MRRNIFTLQPRPPTTACFPSRGLALFFPLFQYEPKPEVFLQPPAIFMMKLLTVQNKLCRGPVILSSPSTGSPLTPFVMVSIQGGWKSFRFRGVLDSILRFDYFNCSAYISKGDIITAYWCYSSFSSQLICHRTFSHARNASLFRRIGAVISLIKGLT